MTMKITISLHTREKEILINNANKQAQGRIYGAGHGSCPPMAIHRKHFSWMLHWYVCYWLV